MRLERIYEGSQIWATAQEYPFGGTTVGARAYVVNRLHSGGGDAPSNVMIYCSSLAMEHFDHIRELGGLSKVLLNHRDEASHHCNDVSDAFAAQVWCHELERESVSTKCRVDHVFAGAVSAIGDDLVAYHAPGHTPGTTSYLFTAADGRKILFLGDTLIQPKPGELSYALDIHPYGTNRSDMRATLDLFEQLEPAMLVSGLSSCGEYVTDWGDADKRTAALRDLKASL